MGHVSKKSKKLLRKAAILTVAAAVSAVFMVHHRQQGSDESFAWGDIPFSPKDRILVLAPHPDDETLGCGGVIQYARERKLPLRLVFLTYGDNNQWSFLVYRKRPVLSPKTAQRMGLVRRNEALAAARDLGLAPDQLTFLGYPDFGVLNIWDAHWGDRPPFRSVLTRVTEVPYQNALRPGTPYKGEEVLQDLKTVLLEFRPTKVFVSHPADHNPDHRALYLFTRVALWDLETEMRPEVYPYLIHFERWPKPKGYRPSRMLEPPSFFRGEIPWKVYRLSEAEGVQKRSALREHKTQYSYSAKYLLSFVRPNELFGDFPPIALRTVSSEISLLPNGTEDSEETSEELTDRERAAFVGFEERFVKLDGNDLVLSIKFSRPLAEAVGASVHIFGYRSDRPFSEMPKLRIQFGAIGHEVYDQDRKLPEETLRVSRTPKRLTIRVPLQALGNPEKILTSAQTSLGDVPLDWLSWRILELPRL